MDMLKTGKLIGQRRAQLGLTQAELAQRLGVTDKAVSKWERGKSLPDIALLNGLASQLHLSVVEILDGEQRNAADTSFRLQTVTAPMPEEYARPVMLTTDAACNTAVSPYLFGINLEHTRRCIFQGISAQLLRNRKFAGKPANRGCAMEWYAIGGQAAFGFTEPYTRHAQQGYHMTRMNECAALSVLNPAQGSAAGIGQHGIAVQEGRRYLFAAVLRTKGITALTVTLQSRSGTVYARGELAVDAADWTRYELVLTPRQGDADADICITAEQQGSVSFGALSLLPEDHFCGMRRDVIDLLRQMGVTVLRWPGGNFAGEYCWFDGLLPVDMRAPLQSHLGLETQPNSMGYDYHEIGTDEFIALCREVGAQPFITINPSWNTPEENAAWVEYCNGSPETPYGSLRAQRGSPEPYNVPFWSLGNEAGYGHMEGDNTPGGYCRIARENARKMLGASPYISLCSSGPYPNPEWAQQSARPLVDIVQLVSLHHYSREPRYAGGAPVQQEYYAALAGAAEMRQRLREMRSMLDDSLKISFDEWNVWYAWYRPSCVTDGIHAALTLHMFMEEADPCGVALVCHFEAVNEGMIIADPGVPAYLTAQGQVFAVMRRHAGGRLCHAAPDAVATVDGEGFITVTAVNASFDSEKPVDLSALGRCVEAVLYTSDTVLPPSRFKEQDVLAAAGTGSLSLPPHSLVLLRFAPDT
ncbi:MAG: helix-turn-helix domain-containing protein [Oscillospiraceae bacterium]|nr:helix-turn-helix domain-containing protein [Oscillospiraceae bacterium]